MNKKGFTLVELIAVIVIISLLALLASVSVTKIVNKSKENISDIQLKLIDSAARNLVTDNVAGIPNEGECSYLTVSDLKKFGYLDSKSNDNINDNLKIKITSRVSSTNGKLIANYELNPSSIDGCYKHMYTNGEIVYFDVLEGKSCTNYVESNSATGYKGTSSKGCLKFYAFLDDGGSKINLLLDHNTKDLVYWTNSSTTSNADGPIDVMTQLKADTSSWKGTLTLSDYVYNHSDNPYKIDYSDYKARLITAQEISKITGSDKLFDWKEASKTSKWYYLDGSRGTNDYWQNQVANSNNKSEYYWLYDRTNNCVTNGCKINDSNTNGYWTSSAVGSNSNQGWVLTYKGWLAADTISKNTNYGVRPVIEVLKSKLN